MNTQDAVARLGNLGPFPSEEEATDVDLRVREELLAAIGRPLSAEDARVLLALFGPDDCYGLSWTLVHLIETAPQPVLTEAPGPDANPWVRLIWERWTRRPA